MVDVPENTSTTASVGQGSVYSGVIDFSGDRDWVRVTLQAGVTYEFNMEGQQTGGGTLIDPLIYGIYDASGQSLGASDDDGGVGRNSRLIFTPTTSGTYYVSLANWIDPTGGESPTGSYEFSFQEFVPEPPSPTTIAVAETVQASGVTGIDGLLSLYRYQNLSGSDLTEVTFSLPTASAVYDRSEYGQPGEGGEPWTGLRGLTSSEAGIFRDALGQAAGFAGLQFTEVPDNSSSAGTIRIAWTGVTDEDAAAWAYYPANSVNAGDIWILSENQDTGGRGSYFQLVVLHELGHALGLKHTFDDGGTGVLMPSQWDGLEYTVMSYNTSVEGTDVLGASMYPTTYMYWDILALQYLYGEISTEAGNTVYSFENGTRYYETIWDTGGTDTYDASTQTAGVTLNLTPGTWSDVGTDITLFMSSGPNRTKSLTVFTPWEVTIENAIGGTGNDRLYGNDVSNRLEGRAGNDYLNGGVGADVMIGGVGNDHYVVDNRSDQVIEASGEGHDTVTSSINYILGDNVEDLSLERGATWGYGNALDNTIYGNSGNRENHLFGMGGNDILYGTLDSDDFLNGGDGDDILEGTDGTNFFIGGAGADTLRGGYGTDTASYVGSFAGVTINLDAGTATGGDATGDILTGIENLIGSSHADVLTGSSANNVLNGAGGADTMVGGAGDDTYYINNRGDVATELAGEGTDTIVSSLNFVLADNFENLTLEDAASWGYGNAVANVLTGGANGDHLFGRGGADTLIGNAGADILDGGSGADEMRGGSGDDLYYVDNAGDQVIESAGEGTDTVIVGFDYTLSDNVENLTLTGRNRTGHGNASNNIIESGSGDDHLFGYAGNDVLNAGAGADEMTGGLGNDTYYVDNRGDTIVETVGEGTDTVISGINYSLAGSLENLTLTGAATWGYGNARNNILVGGTGDDHLFGYAGDDTLNGGAGRDVMTGGRGDDSYYVDSKGDRIVEGAGQGTDTVISSLNLVLGDNLENLTLAGSAHWGYGNALDNVLTGGAGDDRLLAYAGNDTLDGGAGRDYMTGGIGNDTYYVDNKGDKVFENAGEGTDTVISSINIVLADNVENLVLAGSAHWGYGNALDNSLEGGSGNDRLFGRDGNDRLDGGNGADLLVGGTGADTFVFDSLSDSSLGFGIDTIDDFVSGSDRIDLSGIDANANVAGDQAFTFIGSDGFSGTAGELGYVNTDGTGWLYGDVDGDGTADFRLRLTGNPTLQASDITL